MTIEGSFFKMEKIDDSAFYNLSLLTKINKDTDKERVEFKLVAYGIPFDSCIRKIVNYQLRELEGTYTIKEYIEKYEELVNIIGDEIE